jgi:hypothetical protein
MKVFTMIQLPKFNGLKESILGGNSPGSGGKIGEYSRCTGKPNYVQSQAAEMLGISRES